MGGKRGLVGLVGMTESAKKRAARRETDRHTHFGCWQRNPEFYAKHRRLYRIGERLRPCPGCCGCKPGPNCPCSDATYCCEGSGVLPAKRSKSV